MVKVIGIVEDNLITGVKYGTIEVDEHTSEIERAKSAYDSAIAKVKNHPRRKKFAVKKPRTNKKIQKCIQTRLF